MGGLCMHSLIMIRENNHGTLTTTFGVSITALMSECGSTMHCNISMTSRSLPRLHNSARHPASSLYIKKRSTKSKNACGRRDSSRTLALVGWKELTCWIGSKWQLRSWITEQYPNRSVCTGNVGVPPEKGVMLRNDV